MEIKRRNWIAACVLFALRYYGGMDVRKKELAKWKKEMEVRMLIDTKVGDPDFEEFVRRFITNAVAHSLLYPDRSVTETTIGKIGQTYFNNHFGHIAWRMLCVEVENDIFTREDILDTLGKLVAGRIIRDEEESTVFATEPGLAII